MPRFRANLEVGDDGSCMAHVVELPGCIAIGATKEEALARAREAAAAYVEWLQARGEPVADGPIEVELAEEARVGGRFPGSPGDQVAPFRSDLEPVTDADIERALRWLGWSRQELLETFADVPSEALDWPPGSQWTMRWILMHIASAEAWYLRHLDEEAVHALPSTLYAVRDWARVRLKGMAAEERSAVRVHEGEEWTARKVLRRFLEHEREHLGQLSEMVCTWRGEQTAARTDAPCRCFERDVVLARHKHWRLSLSRQQGYLGWCLVILERHETDAANITATEREELWEIVGRARAALQRLFAPDHFNYAFLGNVVRHVHLHLMPRYEGPREFVGKTFRDEHWGWFAIPGTEEAPAEVLAALAEALTRELG